MGQEIIALTIVFFAAVYAVYSTIKTIRVKSSGSCSDSCSCGAKKDISKMLKKSKDFKGRQFTIETLHSN